MKTKGLLSLPGKRRFESARAAAPDDDSDPEAVNILSPEQFVDWNLIKLGRFIEARSRNSLKAELNLSMRQFGALAEVRRNPGIGSRQIGQRLMITAQSAGPLVDGLIAQGYLQREDPRSPGARKALFLTAEGLKMVQRGGAILESQELQDRAALAPYTHHDLNRMLHHLVKVLGVIGI